MFISCHHICLPSFLFLLVYSLFLLHVHEPSLQGSAHVNACSDKEVFDTFTVVAKYGPSF